tara:strand:+ start:3582 stop:4685 length:1104 start_codon:yes stop_codon:yes gene_type:complete
MVMKFTPHSSPHTAGNNDTGKLMRLVVLCTIPGILVQTYFFGWGTLIQLVLAISVALGVEASILKLRQRPISFYLKDNSALLTAVLLGIALPPHLPWWATVIGVTSAIMLGKQLYGGLGFNPFNPAMVGYVVLLIAFPVEMTTWVPVQSISEHQLSFLGSLNMIFTEQVGELTTQSLKQLSISQFDGITAATPLDTVKNDLGNMHSLQESLSSPIFQALAGDLWYVGKGWFWVNLAYLAGGIYLIMRKAITWHIPLSLLATLLIISNMFSLFSEDSYATPIFHLFSGATMLGAFFIATDPVSACTTNKGRIYYGIGIGILLYCIRSWGGYPDAIAFAVLLMNMAAPTIDHYTRPRTYGHRIPTVTKE